MSVQVKGSNHTILAGRDSQVAAKSPRAYLAVRMKKAFQTWLPGIAAGLIALFLAGCHLHRESLSHNGQAAEVKLRLTQETPEIKGTWRSKGDPLLASVRGQSAWLALTLEEPAAGSTFMTTIPRSEVRGLSVATTDPGRKPSVWFAIERDAGALKFLGQREGNEDSGTFIFETNACFVEQANALLARAPSSKEWLEAVFHNVTLADLREIKQAGYWTTLAEVTRLRRNGVTGQYVNSLTRAGYHFTFDELTSLRRSGIASEYAAELKKAGFRLSSEAIIKLRRSGVPAEYIAAVKTAGYSFSCDDIVKLRRAGVPAEYLAALPVPGRASLSADVIIDLRRRGVPPETVQKLR